MHCVRFGWWGGRERAWDMIICYIGRPQGWYSSCVAHLARPRLWNCAPIHLFLNLADIPLNTWLHTTLKKFTSIGWPLICKHNDFHREKFTLEINFIHNSYHWSFDSFTVTVCSWASLRIQALSHGPCTKISPVRAIPLCRVDRQKVPRESVFGLSLIGHFRVSISPGRTTLLGRHHFGSCPSFHHKFINDEEDQLLTLWWVVPSLSIS